MRPIPFRLAAIAWAAGITFCFTAAGPAAAGKPPDQELNRNVILPGGYAIRTAVTGLNFPTGLTFGEGVMYVSESGIAGTQPRVVRVGADGSTSVVASGFNAPVTGVTFHDGWLYVSHRGVISRIHPDGSGREDILTGLPANGDHSNEQITFGSDGKMYFTIGTATNSGVVGPDNFLLSAVPTPDVPCEDIRVHGVNYTSEDPRTSDPSDSVMTGPYQPFGETATEGELIPGAVLCNGAILRANADGTGVEVYAWGFRNPFGLRFDAGGQLWATNNGMDERGSRPVEGDVDALFRVRQGDWYGWPDFAHGVPVDQLTEGDESDEAPELILAEHPTLSSEAGAFALFGDHVSTDGFDFSTSDQFRFVGDAFVAETGSFPPITGAETFFGYRVTRVDMQTGQVSVFLANKSGIPAFVTGTPGINKPIDVKFDPNHPERMLVLDFGAFLPPPGTEQAPGGIVQPGTGTIWLVARRPDLNAQTNGQGKKPVRITRVDATTGPRAARITYRLESAAPSSVRIYDVSGRLVRTLVDVPQGAGDHSVTWDGRDRAGRVVPRGIYVAVAAAGDSRDQRKLAMLSR